MHVERYELRSEPGSITFEFTSEGPRGFIHKLVEFQVTERSGLFNLALGDLDLATGEIDDLSISNNGDTEKILATVAGAVYSFFKQQTGALVYISGSTKARTRLYRMGISKYFRELQQDFYLYGWDGATLTAFEPDKEYTGFLIRPKLV